MMQNHNPYTTLIVLEKVDYKINHIPNGFDNNPYYDILLPLDILYQHRVYYDIYRVFNYRIRIDTRLLDITLRYLEKFGFKLSQINAENHGIPKNLVQKL